MLSKKHSRAEAHAAKIQRMTTLFKDYTGKIEEVIKQEPLSDGETPINCIKCRGKLSLTVEKEVFCSRCDNVSGKSYSYSNSLLAVGRTTIDNEIIYPISRFNRVVVKGIDMTEDLQKMLVALKMKLARINGLILNEDVNLDTLVRLNKLISIIDKIKSI